MKIISGGQTGVDRAALDVGLVLGMEIGGYCPKGRRSEDGRVPDRYPLIETPESNYQIRTEKNIIEADATLICHAGKMGPGTRLTVKLAEGHKKPYRVIHMIDQAPLSFVEFVSKYKTINVGGPRESSSPGISEMTFLFLYLLFSEVK